MITLIRTPYTMSSGNHEDECPVCFDEVKKTRFGRKSSIQFSMPIKDERPLGNLMSCLQLDDYNEFKLKNALQTSSATTPGRPRVTSAAGVDAGLDTGKYGLLRYSMDDWKALTVDKEDQVARIFAEAECTRHEGRATTKDVEQNIQTLQNRSSQALQMRADKTHFWVQELEKLILDIRNETNKLEKLRNRVENSLQAVEKVVPIVNECLRRRIFRTGIDLTFDTVEEELQRERELVVRVIEELEEFAVILRDKIGVNREVKEILERDWSDKKQSFVIDNSAYRIVPYDSTVVRYKGVVRFQEGVTMEDWETRVQEHLQNGNVQMGESEKFREHGSELLKKITGSLKSQEAKVEAALTSRIMETEGQKKRLEHQHKLVLDEVVKAEKAIADIRYALLHNPLECALRLAQTRLFNRTFRPAVEITRDEPQAALVHEATELSKDQAYLTGQLHQGQHALHKLNEVRIELEKEIAVKDNTLVIDRERCQVVRKDGMPSQTALLGNLQ